MMENLTTSLFAKEDIPALVEIEQDTFSAPFKEKDFLTMLENEYSSVLVAKTNGAIVGYVSFMVLFDECSILNFATKKEFKRQGVGKKVMDALLCHGQALGVKKYFLEVRVSNEAAISLYKKYGFVPVGTSKNHFTSPREDALLMNLEL